jgi:hypothetical protein
LVEIPPEIAIKSTIQPGSVYYFPEESLHSTEPHYFVVININPLNDSAIILTCSSSKIEKVKSRRKSCPSVTLIEINPIQYPDFSIQSIIDCNVIFEKSISQIVEKLSSGNLRLKTEMDLSLVNSIRKGIMASPLIENRIKDILQTSAIDN